MKSCLLTRCEMCANIYYEEKIKFNGKYLPLTLLSKDIRKNGKLRDGKEWFF